MLAAAYCPRWFGSHNFFGKLLNSTDMILASHKCLLWNKNKLEVSTDSIKINLFSNAHGFRLNIGAPISLQLEKKTAVKYDNIIDTDA